MVWFTLKRLFVQIDFHGNHIYHQQKCSCMFFHNWNLQLLLSYKLVILHCALFVCGLCTYSTIKFKDSSINRVFVSCLVLSASSYCPLGLVVVLVLQLSLGWCFFLISFQTSACVFLGCFPFSLALFHNKFIHMPKENNGPDALLQGGCSVQVTIYQQGLKV